MILIAYRNENSESSKCQQTHTALKKETMQMSSTSQMAKFPIIHRFISSLWLKGSENKENSWRSKIQWVKPKVEVWTQMHHKRVIIAACQSTVLIRNSEKFPRVGDPKYRRSNHMTMMGMIRWYQWSHNLSPQSPSHLRLDVYLALAWVLRIKEPPLINQMENN